MSSPVRTVVLRNVVAAAPEEAPAHCSAPPLQAARRLPRLSRDAECVTRPRAPLRPLKQEGGSETGAEAKFAMGAADEVVWKVEPLDPVEVVADPRQLCARLSSVRIIPRPASGGQPRGPGRPKGSRSKPRVEPRFDVSAPPEREKARKARAKWAPK